MSVVLVRLVWAVALLCAVWETQAASLSREATQRTGPPPRRLSPVVFIPGNGGSQLEARVSSGTLARSYGCPEREGWFRLWLNVWDFLFGRMDCWGEITRLIYDPETRTSHSPPGVHIRVPGFGDTDTVEFIDPTWIAWASGNIGTYAAPFIDHLVKWGYRRGYNIRGAPYDFRIAPHHQVAYFRDLKNLIEETYRINGNKRVILVAHSMGGLFTIYFLRTQPQAWKNQYVASVMTLNTPWLGTGLITKVYTSGFVFNVEGVDASHLQKVQTSQETAPMLFPRLGAWQHDDVILKTPSRNYTIQDREEFFRDLGYPHAVQMYEDVTGPDYDLEHPGVDFHCVYSHGVDTPFTYIYNEDPRETSRHAQIIHSQGDGTVNLKSLEGCNIFTHMNPHRTNVHPYRGPDHDQIFKDKDFLKQLRSILRQNDSD